MCALLSLYFLIPYAHSVVQRNNTNYVLDEFGLRPNWEHTLNKKTTLYDA